MVDCRQLKGEAVNDHGKVWDCGCRLCNARIELRQYLRQVEIARILFPTTDLDVVYGEETLDAVNQLLTKVRPDMAGAAAVEFSELGRFILTHAMVWAKRNSEFEANRS